MTDDNGRRDSVPIVVQDAQVGLKRSLSKAIPLDNLLVCNYLGLENGLRGLVHALDDNLVVHVQYACVVNRHFFCYLMSFFGLYESFGLSFNL